MAQTVGEMSGRTSVDSILSSALNLIIELGYSAMSMRCLARHLGLQPGSIYHHFDSKADVLDQVIESVIDRRFYSWQRAKPKRANALDLLEHFVAFHVRHQWLFGIEDNLILAELRHLDDARRAALNAELEKYGNEAAALIAACRGGSSGTLDTRFRAAGMLSLLDGATQFHRINSPDSSHRVAHVMFQLTCRLLDIDHRGKGVVSVK